jgi:hypothetical protein
MSEPENFIARWSRRKRKAAEAAEGATPPAPAPGGADDITHAGGNERKADAAPPPPSGTGEPKTSGLDWSKLPPLETITAESDIRAFLAPGVPPELTRAALRRAWAADPRIRDFVGLADYDWDFNTPGSIPGFGSLEMTDELRRQIARMVGSSLEQDGPDKPTPTSTEARGERSPIETAIELAATTPATPTDGTQSKGGISQRSVAEDDSELHNSRALPHRNQEDIATQNDPELPDDGLGVAKRQQHGRALPK